MQAQDYAAARWALGLRAAGSTEATVDRAYDAGEILRTHVMRPTWHFVAPGDIRWMLELTAPRVNARMAPYDRQLELDERVFNRSRTILEKALAGNTYLTRAELAEHLRRGRIHAQGQRLAHLMLRAEQDRVICSGPRRGRQFTYALLDERAPSTPVLTREEGLAELARRYFSSHGPATLRDFTWWSGLTMRGATAGVELAGPALVREVVHDRAYYSAPSESTWRASSGSAFLLPIYDEYVIAYRDRDLVLGAAGGRVADVTGAGFVHHLVVNGRLTGHWRRVAAHDSVHVTAMPFRRLTRGEVGGVEAAAERLAAFVGVRVTLTVT